MDNWTLTEYRDPKSPKVWIFRKNVEPLIVPGSPSHPFICYLTAHYDPRDNRGLPTSEDANILEGIENNEIATLERDGNCLLIGVALKDGIKDFVFYASDGDRFAKHATAIRDAHPEFGFGLQVSHDPDWSAYEDFP